MDISTQIKEFKDLVESSNRILITSHISPDPDAVSSVLLAGTTLATNYPDKQIHMVIEEEPSDLDFLSNYNQIEFKNLADTINKNQPDLLILLDANNFSRASRHDDDKIRQYITDKGIKIVIIDHHEPTGKGPVAVYINQGSPATVQDIYEVSFDKLGLKKPDGYAQTTMTGLYSDTGGFAYDNPRHSDTLKLTDSLISAGANIELIRNNLFRYTQDDMKVLSELAANVVQQDDYSYSFIGDEFIDSWLAAGKSSSELHRGTEPFVNGFLRNTGNRKWGFIVYRNNLQGDNIYSVSFRAVSGVKDVAALASKLGGGGHKPAAGAKFEARSVEQALEKVKRIIAHS